MLVVFCHDGRRVGMQCFIAGIASAFFEFRRLRLFVRDMGSGLSYLGGTVVVDLDFVMDLPLDVGLRRWNFVESAGCHRCFMSRGFISVHSA